MRFQIIERLVVSWLPVANMNLLHDRRLIVAKSQDKKRTSEKKKPQKSIKEKRAAKKAKKADKGES